MYKVTCSSAGPMKSPGHHPEMFNSLRLAMANDISGFWFFTRGIIDL